MATKDYASESSRDGGKTAMEELEYFIANKLVMDSRPTYLYSQNPDALRKRIMELIEEKPTKTSLLDKLKQAFSLPSAWRTSEPKVSKWVSEINSIPLKIIIEAQADGSIEPWWDITMTYANGYTDKMKLKYKKRNGYIDYEPMRKVFKCILKNWRAR